MFNGINSRTYWLVFGVLVIIGLSSILYLFFYEDSREEVVLLELKIENLKEQLDKEKEKYLLLQEQKAELEDQKKLVWKKLLETKEARTYDIDFEKCSPSAEPITRSAETRVMNCWPYLIEKRKSFRKLEDNPPCQGTIIFHMYWRPDLSEFGRKQAAVVRSFAATQNPNHTRLWIWSKSRFSSPDWNEVSKIPGVEFRLYDLGSEVIDTPLEHVLEKLPSSLQDNKAWIDGDLFRAIMIYKYGGVYTDFDVMYVNDYSPILNFEYISEWDMDPPNYWLMNNANMRLFRRGKWATRVINKIAGDIENGRIEPNSMKWNGDLNTVLWREEIAQNVTPSVNILPYCFMDGTTPGSISEMFKSKTKEDSCWNLLDQVFAFHWHSRWTDPIEPNSMFLYLEEKHHSILKERYPFLYPNVTVPI